MKPNSSVLDSDFTIGAIVDRLTCHHAKKIDTDEQLVDFIAEDVTGGKAFFGRIIRVKFIWREPFNYISSVILKVPGTQQSGAIRGSIENSDYNLDDEEKRNIEYLTYAHEKEIIFYNRFANGLSSLALPYFYYGDSYNAHARKGIIMMQDLSEDCITTPLVPGFGNAQVESLIEQIAILHASSIEIVQQLRAELPKHSLRDYYIGLMKETINDLVKIRPEYFKESVEKLMPTFTAENYVKAEYDKNKYGMPPVLVHGDLWTGNVLWKKHIDGTASDNIGAIIDWQTTHLGNPFEDLLRVLSLNVSGKFRRQNTKRLLELYRSKMIDLGIKASTLGKLEEAFTAAMPFTAMYLGFGAVMYYHMNAICRNADEREELLLRVKMFFDDVIHAYSL